MRCASSCFLCIPKKIRVVIPPGGVEYGNVEKVRKVTLEGRFGSSRQGNYNTGPDPPQQAHIPRIKSRCTEKMTTKAEDTGDDSGASMARRLVVVAGRITCKRLAEPGRVGTDNTEITRFPHQIWLSQRISLSGCARTNFPRWKPLSPKGESLASFQALHSPRPIDASVARPSFLILLRAPLPWFLLFCCYSSRLSRLRKGLSVARRSAAELDLSRSIQDSGVRRLSLPHCIVRKGIYWVYLTFCSSRSLARPVDCEGYRGELPLNQ